MPIPKGFQPIAGGQRSATTGQAPPDDSYPEGIAARVRAGIAPEDRSLDGRRLQSLPG